MIIIFDVIGTLFSLNRIRKQFRERGIDETLVDYWFARLLQSGMTSTLAGRYVSFKLLAEYSLRQVFAVNNIKQDTAGFLKTFYELDPWEDARDCVRKLKGNGHILVALTNTGVDNVNQLLKRAQLEMFFDTMFSADNVTAFKPHPAPYRFVLTRMSVERTDTLMVSAHGWDILGAAGVKIPTLYISSIEKQWPFPGNPPGQVASTLSAVPEAIAGKMNASLRRSA